MSKLPNLAGNLKCWRKLNNIVFSDRVSCPDCSSGLQENYPAGYLWCRGCRRKYRPTAHKSSWLYGMKLKPKQLFVLLWCWQHKKSPDTARLLADVSYTTAQRWYERFRKHIPLDGSAAILAGLVQIDESYFGKQKSRQPQTIVVGAIEPDTRRVSLRITNSRSQIALEQFVTDTITQGSLVVSDNGTVTRSCRFWAMGTSRGTTVLASLPAPTRLRDCGAASSVTYENCTVVSRLKTYRSS